MRTRTQAQVAIAESPMTIAAEGVRLRGTPRTATVTRLRRARLDDVPYIMPMLNDYAEQGLLLPRTADQVYRAIREFTVAVDAEGIVGSGALRIYSTELAEIGALAVHERAQRHGVGRAIVESLLEEARDLGMTRVFAMTLQEGFFHKIGFHTVSIASFPQKIAQDCAGCSRRTQCREIAVEYVF